MSDDVAHDTSETMIAAPTAVQNPAIVKPGTTSATSATIPAFSTSRNSPSVSDRERQREHERQRPYDGVDDAEQHGRTARAAPSTRI